MTRGMVEVLGRVEVASIVERHFLLYRDDREASKKCSGHQSTVGCMTGNGKSDKTACSGHQSTRSCEEITSKLTRK
jgi:sialic acid synthase SpsE